MTKNNNHIQYIDFLNVICTISVVILHANSCFWHFSSTQNYWIRANIIESLFYFCVPIFFMLTGIKLIDYNKRYSFKEYLLKRINKTIIPYVFWSILIIYYALIVFKFFPLEYLNTRILLNTLYLGNAIDAYWFFIPLFSLYLIIPIFAHIEDKYKKTIFLYFTLSYLLLKLILTILTNAVSLEFVDYVGFETGIKYFIFIAIGYLIHNFKINSKLKFLLYFLSLISLLTHLIGTYILSINANKIIDIFKDNTGILTIFYATGIFIFLKENSDKIMKNKTIFNIINFLKNYTFGIYLLHSIIIKTIHKLDIINYYSWQYVPIASILSISISIILIIFIRQIPLLKRTLPK